MAKFCVKCGARLDEITKLCPNCSKKGLEAVPKQSIVSSDPTRGNNHKPVPAKEEISRRVKRKRKRPLRIVAISLCLVTVLTLAAGALVYFDILKIPILSTAIDNFEAKKDIMRTLDTMLDRSSGSNAYILGNPSFAETSYDIFTDNPVSEKISQMVEYDVMKVETNRPIGTAEIAITAPDVQQILNATIKGSTTDDIDALLKEVSLRLDAEYPTISETFTCTIEYSRGDWYLVPHAELFDAMSGNLYSFYNDMVAKMLEEIESITGGANDAE